MMEFLYFPEDPSDYIPALITLVIFMIGAVAALYLFMKKAKKEEEEAQERYADMYHAAEKMSEQSKEKDDQSI